MTTDTTGTMWASHGARLFRYDGTSWSVFHSENSARQNNGSYAYQVIGRRWSVADSEGTNGLPYVSDADPRTPTEENPGGGFSSTEHWSQLKYPDQGTDIPLATGIEARLIEAEAELAVDDYAGMTAILQTLRDDSGVDFGGATLPAVATEAAAIDQLFEERAFWLFLTGHRLGDLRRLMYQYGRAEDAVYPTGGYHKGGSYGNDVVFPVDFDEGTNTLYDPEACDVTSASIN